MSLEDHSRLDLSPDEVEGVMSAGTSRQEGPHYDSQTGRGVYCVLYTTEQGSTMYHKFIVILTCMIHILQG